MGSPAISTTEFIQNDSPKVTSPRSPTGPGGNNLVSHLKLSLQQAQNELNQQIFENSELKIYKSKFEDLSNDYNVLSSRFDSLENEKKFSDIEIANLRKETEELSSQLFSEANDMVSKARKEAFETRRSNDTLKNEINEKDNLIHILKSQLNDLKAMLQDKDDNDAAFINRNFQDQSDENKDIEIKFYANESLENGSVVAETFKQISSRNHSNSNLSLSGKQPATLSPSNFIYAPTVQSMRYDIKSFEQFREFGEKLYHDFKAGLHTSNSKTSYLEIKEHKFYRKLLNDDIEPALRLDEAPGVPWLSKKSLITGMLVGKVSIEPISSINESYKTDVVMNNLNEMNIGSSPKISSPNANGGYEPPVAFEDPCSLCGEQRNDTLDHSRLYILKVIGTKTIRKNKDPAAPSQTTFSKLVSNKNNKDTITITQEYIANQYPLCSYCLHRVRSVCELFAFLRGMKAGIWKFDTELNCQKNWIECVRIRTKIFYSRIGIIESNGNLINNNSFSFTSGQISAAESSNTITHLGLSNNRNSGYFSNYGSILSSPVMTNFGSFVKDSPTPPAELESESSSTKNSGIFSNRNSLIGSFWGASSSPGPSAINTPANSSTLTQAASPASPTFAKKKDHPMSVFSGSNSSFSSDKLEGKIDEVIVTTATGSPFKAAVPAPIESQDPEPIKLEPISVTTSSPERAEKKLVEKYAKLTSPVSRTSSFTKISAPEQSTVEATAQIIGHSDLRTIESESPVEEVAKEVEQEGTLSPSPPPSSELEHVVSNTSDQFVDATSA